MPDFFISYAPSDRGWAQWIAWVLEEAGYSVRIRAWDFRAGQNEILETDRALTEARQVVAVLTQAYVRENSTRTEWSAALRRDPPGGEPSLAPVRVEECRPEGLLGPLLPVDLVGLDEAEARETLLAALARAPDRAERGRRPVFPLGEARSGPAARAPAPYPGLSGPPAPAGGRLIHRMCDRGEQDAEFIRFFRHRFHSRPGIPQLYFLHGEEGEAHESLVERLIQTHVVRRVTSRWGEHRSSIDHKRLAWVYNAGFEEFLEMVFHEIDPQHREKELSPAALIRLARRTKKPVLALEHSIWQKQWNRHAASLLDRYLEFWSQVDARRPEPLFLVFFDFRYPQAAGDARRMLQSLAGWWYRHRFIQTVREKEKLYFQRVRLLTELSPISPPEVRNWFIRYRIYESDPAKRDQFCGALFRNAARLPMQQVEPELDRIHREFLHQADR